MSGRRRSGLTPTWLALGDAAAVVLAYGLALILRFHGLGLTGPHLANRLALERALPLIVAFALVLAQVYGLYERYPLPWPEQVQGLFLLVALDAVFAMAASFFVRAFAVPRSVLALGAVLAFLALYAYRRAVHLRWLRRYGPPALLFVCGEGTDADLPRPESGAFRVTGRVACPPEVGPDLRARVAEALRQAQAEGLLLDDGLPGRVKEDLALLCLEQGWELFVVPRLLDLLFLQSRPALYGDRLVVNLGTSQGAAYQRFLKRAIDVGLSALFLLLGLPVLLVAAAAILADDGPPVLYRQERLGLGGRPFTVLKLRTMRRDAEAATGPVLAAPQDPRVTRVGRWLRRLHVDELPQLWNVLRGEMSLVGPRPERPAIHAEVASHVPAFDARLAVLPGLTGLAQVHGRYHTHPREKLKFDVLYALRASAAMDAQILLRTLRNVLGGLRSPTGPQA